MSGRLQGKVALISGTARGQGAEAKARFEAEGATVVGGDILTQGGTPYLDVTDEDSVVAWIAARSRRPRSHRHPLQQRRSGALRRD